MSVFAKFMRRAMLARYGYIEHQVERAVEVQYSTLRNLLERCRYTAFGRRYGLHRVHNAEQFAERVGRFDYSSYQEYITRMRRGESNVACEGRVGMFAISSGSTSARSKYIPLTREMMRRNHLQGMADVVTMYLHENLSSRLFEGRTLTMGGSCRVEDGALVGDLSALTMAFTGGWLSTVRAPNRKAALIEDFDTKCEAIWRECEKQRIVALAGVPSWTMALLRRVLEWSGKSSIADVWHHIELFMHGGVSFKPYREAFAQIMGRKMNYLESYNASEGFVAIADRCGSEDMLLMPHYGCYYEFARGENVVPLEGVRRGVDYALLMTTVGGLWRYELGDVVRFTSIDPYRLRIVGRVRQYINAFGEELMEGNAEEALLKACVMTGAVVEEYSVAPCFFEGAAGGYHLWVVEFASLPDDVESFAMALDAALREINSDYDAKRRSVMAAAVVKTVPRGTFHRWQALSSRRKVPRLLTDRTTIDDILSCAEGGWSYGGDKELEKEET